jgi:hypothetical protein
MKKPDKGIKAYASALNRAILLAGESIDLADQYSGGDSETAKHLADELDSLTRLEDKLESKFIEGLPNEQPSQHDLERLKWSGSGINRGTFHYFIDTHFPDKTADLTSVLILFGWIDYQTYKAEFRIGSQAPVRASVKPREWYVETDFCGTNIKIWPYGHYVGCRSDGVYHIADVTPSNRLGDGFIIHFLSDGTIEAGCTYDDGV